MRAIQRPYSRTDRMSSALEDGMPRPNAVCIRQVQ